MLQDQKSGYRVDIATPSVRLEDGRQAFRISRNLAPGCRRARQNLARPRSSLSLFEIMLQLSQAQIKQKKDQARTCKIRKESCLEQARRSFLPGTDENDRGEDRGGLGSGLARPPLPGQDREGQDNKPSRNT